MLDEHRCDCGKLLFKLTKRGLEFMCHRCKRIHLVPYEQMTDEFQNVCPAINIVLNATKKESTR